MKQLLAFLFISIAAVSNAGTIIVIRPDMRPTVYEDPTQPCDKTKTYKEGPDGEYLYSTETFCKDHNFRQISYSDGSEVNYPRFGYKDYSDRLKMTLGTTTTVNVGRRGPGMPMIITQDVRKQAFGPVLAGYSVSIELQRQGVLNDSSLVFGTSYSGYHIFRKVYHHDKLWTLEIERDITDSEYYDLERKAQEIIAKSKTAQDDHSADRKESTDEKSNR